MSEQSLFVSRRVFRAGDVIFSQGDKRDFAYILEKGSVDISARRDGGVNTLLNVGSGDVFGETAIIEGGLRSATAKAREKTYVYVIDPAVLKERMASLDPLVKLLVSMLIEKYKQSRIKQSGDDGVACFVTDSEEQLIDSYEEQKQTVLRELQMEQELRRALDDREFKPYLQPIVDFSNGKILGYETLVRWHHPKRGVIYPNDFIPIAERTNVVQMIDACMLEAACEIIPQLHKIASADAEHMFISVNLSGANFDDESVVDRVKTALAGKPFHPSQIKLEITESALVNDSDKAAMILNKLKETGVVIALDDFGTGYSSLGYLHKFTIDCLKIDRSFVQQLHTSQKSLDIVKAVVGLAHTFKLSIIAEGIEEESEVEILKKLGCSYGQGYYFGRPTEASEALQLFARQYETGRVKQKAALSETV